ncbi:MAG: DUF3393 domain-containing protein [Cytophagia bacterium]|jgi:membrane-bound lytic murein transglycosylase C|nr:DUF3393 domain-containing protein [Cytophagia bacterium]
MNKCILISSCVFLLSVFHLSFAQDDFEKWKEEQEAEVASMAEAEVKYLESVTNEYDVYVEEQKRLFENFKTEVEKKWDEFKSSTSKMFVDYDGDLNARSSIDFEKGVIEIEVIIDDVPEKTADQKHKEGISALEKKIQKLINQESDDKKPLLKDQIKTRSGQSVTPQKAKTYAREIVEEQKIDQKRIKAKDNSPRIKYTVKVQMIPNHVEVRAKQFKQVVLKQSKRFNIDPAVAFAIMETESSFNPKARSHIPAYGLMQLVPGSGARDAYRYVYKKDKLLRGEYLYKPANNIELGCAYISKIFHVYFKGIENKKSAYFCTIAAYNTGPGNVAKALTGTTKLKPVVDVANSKSPEKVYIELQNELPYKETIHYLEKVNNRMSYYQAWLIE